MAKTPSFCASCQFFYQPEEGNAIFPQFDSETEGFCRVILPRNRGGRVMISTMYPVVLKLLPACGEFNAGSQDW